MSSSKMARKVLFQITGLCAVLHLLVDGLCVCCLYLMASTHSIAELTGIFVTYNVLAFITQPLTGACVDRIKQKHWMLLTSNILLTLAVLSTSIVVSANPTASWMLPSAILLGIGNSLWKARGCCFKKRYASTWNIRFYWCIRSCSWNCLLLLVITQFLSTCHLFFVNNMH